MQQFKRAVRSAILYATMLVLIGAPSAAVYASDDYYDAENDKWNSSEWVYNPTTKQYEAAPTPTPSPTPTPEPPAEETNPPADNTPSTDSSAADITAQTGPSSNSTVTDDTTANSDTNINNKSTIDNSLDSNASTGNAGVMQNTNGGNATTGDASADATIVSSVHSTVGTGETSGIAHFTIDLYGDVNGDIVVGPAMANAEVDKTTNINSNTNVNNDASITNNINLTAQSGDATVSGNTMAGSAQSGDARAVANLINLINTVIAANKSFVGTINIHGNLNGDILLSPEFIPQLLAANGDSTVESNINMPLSTNINDNQTIVNNVDLQATSGTATVTDNTSAGSAQSGTAQTDLQILNLTGHEVDAENSVLVFVNVKGKWVGMIMDAPGSTAAAFGSGVTRNDVNLASTSNLNNKASITNNINVAAISGDATVSSNTSGGDAKTGNASASANIANIIGSKFNLSGWFAVLFINIDGDWTGWALKDTDAGNKIAGAVQIASSATPPPSVGAPNVRLGYIPQVSDDYGQLVNGVSQSGANDPYAAAVLASATKNSNGSLSTPLIPVPSPREDPFSVILMVGGFGVAGISGIAWAARRLLELRAANRVSELAP
jgi:hypothetical protein